jgi:hypothetical protein
MEFLHGVYFVPRIDDHYKNSDLFTVLKLKYLKEMYGKRKYCRSPTKIHCVSVEPASFRNRNKRNYKLRVFTKDSYTQEEQERCKSMLNYFLKNEHEVIPRMSCNVYDCSKRAECVML